MDPFGRRQHASGAMMPHDGYSSAMVHGGGWSETQNHGIVTAGSAGILQHGIFGGGLRTNVNGGAFFGAPGGGGGAPGCRLRKDSFVHDVYRLGPTLGEGAFSEVLQATHLATGQQVACKKMKLPPPSDPRYALTTQEIFKEIDILGSLQHENLLALIEYFVEGDHIYLFTELVEGGDLLSMLHKMESFSEHSARYVFVQLLRGVEHMHARNIAHRDLKLENILLSSTGVGQFTIKIGDFGLAKHVDNRGYLTTVCGSPQYVAPEVVAGGAHAVYGPQVDMWGAGVVLYMLLAGYPPFEGDSHAELFAQVSAGRYNFDLPVWDEVSGEAKDLIRRLLVVNPALRLSATDALRHPWLMGTVQPQASVPTKWGSRMKEAMRKPFSGITKSFSRKQ